MADTKIDRTIRVVPGSSSSFLCPPGHPMLEFSIIAGPGMDTKRGPNLIAGLDYALENKHGDVPPAVTEQVKELYASHPLVRSELWEAGVYGYFKGCYSPDGVERRTDRLLIVGMEEPLYPGHPLVESGEQDLDHHYPSLNRGPVVAADDPRCVPEHHAAYLLVKTYFPDAEPRPDLIANKGGGVYGQKPCAKCGQSLQYEAKVDAYAIPISAIRDCPQGGLHEVADKEDSSA
jgi:hypothetical protein